MATSTAPSGSPPHSFMPGHRDQGAVYYSISSRAVALQDYAAGHRGSEVARCLWRLVKNHRRDLSLPAMPEYQLMPTFRRRDLSHENALAFQCPSWALGTGHPTARTDWHTSNGPRDAVSESNTSQTCKTLNGDYPSLVTLRNGNGVRAKSQTASISRRIACASQSI